jgi:hypothetical protein
VVEVKVAAKLEAAVVIGVLQERVKVEVFESAFVAKAEAKVECIGLEPVSTLRAKNMSRYIHHPHRCYRMVAVHCPFAAAVAARSAVGLAVAAHSVRTTASNVA